MSSPPAVDFPDSDAPMDGDLNSDRPQNAAPLFLPSTPSVAGTPRRRTGGSTANNTPTRGVTARRALGMSTPRRPPPFDARSSSPQLRLSSTPGSRAALPGAPDSDTLEFPESPARPVRPNRRGDINPTIAFSPNQTNKPTSRRVRLTTDDEEDVATSDGMALDVPQTGPTLSVAGAPSDQPFDLRAIWGTNINVQDTMQLIRDFILGFKPKYRAAYDRKMGLPSKAFASPEESETTQYETYLRQMRQTGQNILNVDVVNIKAYPKTERLYIWLQKYPQEVIPAMDQVLGDLMVELTILDQEADMHDMGGEKGDRELASIRDLTYRVRPFGYPSINMRDLNPTDTDKLVCIKGLVIRATPIIPEMTLAFFRCLTCGHTMQQEINRGKIDEPARCPREVCQSMGSMSLIHNRSEFSDRQVVRLQETPDAVPDGQTPHTVTLSVYDELVDVSKPGDRILATGIFRTTPTRVNPRQRTMKSLFKTYLDVIHITIGQSGSLGVDRSTRPTDRMPGVGGLGDIAYSEDEISSDGRHSKSNRQLEVEAKVLELGKRPDIYDLLSRSLAPSIWEMDDVKKGILLQLFGGANKSVARGGGGEGPKYRGDINVLLVGDPCNANVLFSSMFTRLPLGECTPLVKGPRLLVSPPTLREILILSSWS
jgi:DNA replication licensing factor MCM4